MKVLSYTYNALFTVYVWNCICLEFGAGFVLKDRMKYFEAFYVYTFSIYHAKISFWFVFNFHGTVSILRL